MPERQVVEFQPKPAVVLACYVILVAIALVPVFVFEIAPLGDWPNHLARASIMSRIGSNPVLQQHYEVHWHLFAFQSTDLILPELLSLFGLAGANLYIAATFVLLIAGTAAVHRVLFGRVGLWPAFAVLFLFNLPLAVGQVSFLLATALSLLLLAAWIATEGRRGWIRTALFALGALALFFCHFLAFASYAVIVMAFEAARPGSFARRVGHLVEAGLPFVVPAILYLWTFDYTIRGPTDYGSVLAKPIAWMSAIITYASWNDVVVMIGIGGALWLLDRRKLLGFSRAMRFPASVLLLLAAAMPHMLSGVLGADIRIPCLLAFVLLAASEVKWQGRRQVAVFVVGVAALLSFRVATTTALWQDFDAGYREFRAADAVLERGSRVMVIPAKPENIDPHRPLTAYPFVSSLAVMDRDVLLPDLYTIATPLKFSPSGVATIGIAQPHPGEVHWAPIDPRFRAVAPQTVRQIEDVAAFLSSKSAPGQFIDWSDWPERYDYVIDFHLGRPENPVPALLTELRRGSYFSIYRIHPPEHP